jgi:hypothetical protein
MATCVGQAQRPLAPALLLPGRGGHCCCRGGGRGVEGGVGEIGEVGEVGSGGLNRLALVGTCM